MSKMKTNGFHFGPGGNATGSKDFFLALDAAGIPAIAKSTDSMTGIYDLQEIMRSSSVPHVCVFRPSTHGQNDGYDYDVPAYHLDAESAAMIHWARVRDTIPPELDPQLTWIEGINEVDKQHSEWLGLFGQYFASYAMRAGFKVLLFGWSSGEPEPEHWEGREMVNFLRLCAAQPDRVGISVHEYDYGLNGPSHPAVAGWHYGRYRNIHATCDKYGIMRPTIVVTEWGWAYDHVPNTVVDWSEEASRLYYNELNVLGCALWYLGPGFGGIANQLNPYMKPLKERILAVELPDPEDVPVKHKAIVVKLPQDATIEEWVDASATAYESRHTQTASEDDMYTILAGGNDESYVKFSHPEREPEVVVRLQENGYLWEPLYADTPTPPIEPGDYLAVTPISQRDARWKSLPIGESTGHDKTIGNWGCLLTAYNMQAQYWGLTERLPDEENLHYIKSGAFSGPFLRPAAFRTAYPDDVAYIGFKTRSDPTMRPQIRNWIDNGWPVPCRVDFDPTDTDFDQHWVLVIGYSGDTDFWMADPWHGDIAIVNDRYAIAGSDILEAIFYTPFEAPPVETIDLVEYMFPTDRRIYEVRHPDGSQERIQTQVEGNVAYIAKGENQGYWERWEWDDKYIYLVRDTSPEADPSGVPVYYEVKRADGTRSPYCLRHMAVSQTFNDGGHIVTFKRKDNCQPNNDPRSGNSANSTTFLLHSDVEQMPTGIVVNDIVYIRGNTEIHGFARGLGRVYWSAPWGESSISELHAPGARPDIVRERLNCV